MKALESISELFGLFHDGRIAAGKLQESACELTIDIEYLAERVAPGYSKFTVQLLDFSDPCLQPWSDEDGDSTMPAIEDFDRIAALDLGILSAEIAGDNPSDARVRVHCTQDFHDSGFSGGVFSFSASGFKVSDEPGRAWSLDEMKKLSADYWSDWEKAHRGAAK